MNKIIDCHTHAFPDKIAAKAISKLASVSKPYVPHTDGTAQDLIRLLDENNITHSLIANIATNPDQVHNILSWSQYLLEQYKGKLIPLASFHPKSPTVESDLSLCLQSNLPGFKFHPLYQDFNIDDQYMDEIYNKIAKSNKFILFHNGYDIAFPKSCDNASPYRMAKVLEKHPDLKVIASHFGGWYDWDNVYNTLAGANLYIDISFIEEMPIDLVYKIFEKHGEDKFVFGSDSPWLDVPKLIEFINNLEISQVAKEKLFYKNAQKLLNL